MRLQTDRMGRLLLGLRVVGAVLGGIAASLSSAAAADAARPNILWICVEDMSPHMGCYGETTIATPNIDALAGQGARFTRCFVTAPVCSPSRSALITGMYQTSIGAHNHRSSRGEVKIHLPEHVKPLPVLFQQAGYYTVLGGRKRGRAATRGGLAKSDYNFVWDEAMYDGNDWSGRRPGQPFFAQWQLAGGKNRAAQVPQPVDPADVRLPPYYPDHPVLREDWARYLNAVINTDLEVGEILARLRSEGLADSTAVFFFTDHGISHVRDKQFCYEGGIHVPLLVRWPGRIAPGTVRDDLVSHIDVSATSLQLAGIGVPEYMQGRTLLGPSAAPREYVVAARDRCDETIDRIRSIRDQRYKYIRNFYPQYSHAQPNAYKDAKQIMQVMRSLAAEGKLNDGQARVFLPTRPEEELYDLELDPYELSNLAGSAEHAATLERMRKRLDRWMTETDDQGRHPESAESLASEEPDYYGPAKKLPAPSEAAGR